MASLFDDIDGSLQAAMDRVFGEAIRVVPRLAGNYSAGPDNSRPAKDSRAILSRSPNASATDYLGTNRPGSELSLARSELWMTRAEYLALGYELRRGDAIELTDKGTPPPVVTVAEVQMGDHGDICIPFTAGGAS